MYLWPLHSGTNCNSTPDFGTLLQKKRRCRYEKHHGPTTFIAFWMAATMMFLVSAFSEQWQAKTVACKPCMLAVPAWLPMTLHLRYCAATHTGHIVQRNRLFLMHTLFFLKSGTPPSCTALEGRSSALPCKKKALLTKKSLIAWKRVLKRVLAPSLRFLCNN